MTQIETELRKSTIGERNLIIEQQFKKNKYKKVKTTWVDPGNHKMRRIGFRQLTKAYLTGCSRSSSNNKIEPYALAGSEGLITKDYKNNKILLNENDINVNQTNLKTIDRSLIGCNKITTNCEKKNDNITFESEMEFVSLPKEIIIRSRDSDLEYQPLDCSTTRVVLKDVPENTGLESIISQIKGGPLKRITVVNDSDSGITTDTILFEFLYLADAIEFMKYANTNMFKVNGIHHQFMWDDKHKIDNQKSTCSLPIEEMKEPRKTRCLILKSNYRKKVRRYNPKMTNTILNFDPEEVQTDFSIFGEIQALTPIISRRLCISIVFMDILDSIKAMECLQNPTTYMHKKYYKKWTIWYGPDLTDQPCLT